MIQTLIDNAKKYYDTPTRYYHTWQHVEDCILVVSKLTANTRFNTPMCEQIKVAIAYHDCIYIPGSKVNEEASKDVMLYEARKLGISPDHLAAATSAILATGHHAQPAGTAENSTPDLITQVVLDADLSVLSLPYKEFRLKQKLIAKEYDAYLSQQAEFLLKTFYFKPKIFHFSDDDIAKENIKRLFQEET